MFSCLCIAFVFLLNVPHASYIFTNFNDYSSSSDSVFVHIHFNTDKDADCHQGITTPLQIIYGYFFSASFLFLKVWFNKSGNKK